MGNADSAMKERMRWIFLIFAALFSVAAFAPWEGPRQTDPYQAEAWEIGPWIYWRKQWRNYSKGMPNTPTQQGKGWSFDFPYPDAASGHVHYLTYRHGPLAGARKITLRYRIDAAAGTRFVPQERPEQEATLSLYFQQRGDKWNGKGRYAAYRWYAPADKLIPVEPGTHTVSIGLDDRWIPVTGGKGLRDSAAYDRALHRTGRVGFVFGSASGRGHGVFATQPARFTLLEFTVE